MLSISHLLLASALQSNLRKIFTSFFHFSNVTSGAHYCLNTFSNTTDGTISKKETERKRQAVSLKISNYTRPTTTEETHTFLLEISSLICMATLISFNISPEGNHIQIDFTPQQSKQNRFYFLYIPKWACTFAFSNFTSKQTISYFSFLVKRPELSWCYRIT